MTTIKKLILKYKSYLIVTLTVSLVVTALINFFFIFEITAQSNDECLWVPKKVSHDSTAVYFDQVKFEGVTWEAGIRDGDQLLAIDGVKITNTVVATQVLDKIKKGDYATYTIKRDNRIFETKVEVKKLINFQGLGIALLSVIWLLVGFVVVMAKPDGKTQNLFYQVGVYAVLFSLVNLFYRVNYMQGQIFQSVYYFLTVDILWTIGASFLAVKVVHFFLVFPKKYSIVETVSFRRIINFAPLTIFGISFIYRIFFIYFNPIGNYQLVASYHGIIVLLGFVVGLVLLFRSYLKLESQKDRTPIFIILVAYAFGIATIIYTLTLANVLADTIFNSPSYYMPVILIAVIPIAFGYSIFRYSLMDVSDLIKNAVMYGVATVSVAAIYFFVIYVIGQSVSQAIGTEFQGLIAGVIFIVFALVFQSTKDRFQSLITSKFYPEQFAFQRVLLKFSNEVYSIVGWENILDSMHSTFVNSLKLQHFGIALSQNSGKTFKLVRSIGMVNGSMIIDQSPQKIIKFINEKETLHKQPVIERNDFEDVFENNFEELLDEEIYTIIPMRNKSKIVGLLLFGLKYSGAQFAGKDLELLVAAANQSAVALENARLYESEAEKMRIERDLENAKKIQESLLPKKIPEVIGLDICGKMIPAMQVGGDYYDVIKVSDSKVFVVIGDVSGKGLAASFYMTKLQTMMRLNCVSGKSPKEILMEINKNISVDIDKHWFITIAVALFDTKENKVTFCRAGHTPVLYLNDESEKLFQANGIGVGLEKGEVFNSTLEEVILPLKSDDLFVFFSDGVNETMNEKDELYGMDRLKIVCRDNLKHESKLIMRGILESIKSFQGCAHQHDDVTLTVVKVTD